MTLGVNYHSLWPQQPSCCYVMPHFALSQQPGFLSDVVPEGKQLTGSLSHRAPGWLCVCVCVFINDPPISHTMVTVI